MEEASEIMKMMQAITFLHLRVAYSCGVPLQVAGHAGNV